MKALIRWILNHIPRTVLQRMASWAVPVIGLLYTAIAMIQLSDKARIQTKFHRIFAAVMEYGMFAFIALITSILLVWNQW